MIKKCQCGCGTEILTKHNFIYGHGNKDIERVCKCGQTFITKLHDNHYFLHGHNFKKLKNNTWKNLYGEEKAKEMKKNLAEHTRSKFKGVPKTEEHKKHMSQSQLNTSYEDRIKRLKEANDKKKKLDQPIHNKGKTNIELYGKEKAEELKLKNRNKSLGKTYEEIHGVKKAKELKEKLKTKKWTEEKIVKAYLDIVKNNGAIKKSDIDKKFAKQGKICYSACINKTLGSLDDLAELTNVEFKHTTISGRIGKNETKILDAIEKENEISIQRQFYVNGKFVDGYDKENNIVYEVDEEYHKYQRVQDFLRDKKIKQKLGCDIIRVDEQCALKKLSGEQI